MTDSILSDSDLAKLRALDTPTICNALEIILPARRGIGFTTKPLVCARPHLPPMSAMHARRRSAPPIGRGRRQAMRQRRLDYYRHASEAGAAHRPAGGFDAEPGWRLLGRGEQQIHMGSAAWASSPPASGDIPACAEGFPCWQGVSSSHAYVHVVRS
jgi:hypothetical protein